MTAVPSSDGFCHAARRIKCKTLVLYHNPAHHHSSLHDLAPRSRGQEDGLRASLGVIHLSLVAPSCVCSK